MNWADFAILAVLVLSCLISLKRGFVKEALSMANWVLAFFIAVTFRDALSSLLVNTITSPSLRDMVAFAALFALTLVVGAMVNYLIGEVVRMTGLGGTDRLLGVIFGAVRGFVIVMALLLLVPAVVPINEEVWWQQSALIPYFLSMENWTREATSGLLGFLSGLFS